VLPVRGEVSTTSKAIPAATPIRSTTPQKARRDFDTLRGAGTDGGVTDTPSEDIPPCV
jgi:hypothetical protein